MYHLSIGVIAPVDKSSVWFDATPVALADLSYKQSGDDNKPGTSNVKNPPIVFKKSNKNFGTSGLHVVDARIAVSTCIRATIIRCKAFTF